MSRITLLAALALADLVVCFAASVALADTTTTVDYGPALECKAPVGGVSACTVKATGQKVQCSVVDGIKFCF